MKAAMNTFLEAGLKKTGRDQAAVDALVNTFYGRLAERLVANPVNASYPTVRVLLRRKA
jgi:truncated hemoglobin YjbI